MTNQNCCCARFAIFKNSNWNYFARGCRRPVFRSNLACALLIALTIAAIFMGAITLINSRQSNAKRPSIVPVTKS